MSEASEMSDDTGDDMSNGMGDMRARDDWMPLPLAPEVRQRLNGVPLVVMLDVDGMLGPSRHLRLVGARDDRRQRAVHVEHHH